MSDELASIAGLAPAVLMDVGEEKEVGSATSKSVYKVKRHPDHYFCSCPAWRNQKGVATDARTCKHLKALLGDAYENARILAKGGEVKPAASKAKAKAAPKAKAEPKAKAPAKAKAAPKAKPAVKAKAAPKTTARGRKAAAVKEEDDDDDVGEGEDDDEHEDEEEEEEEEAEPPAKKARTTRGAKATAKATASKAKAPTARSRGGKKEKVKEDEVEDEEEGVKDKEDVKEEEPEDDGAMDVDVDGAGADPNDELAVINGVRPLILLADEETREVGSKTSKSVYKVKRTMGHYYCTCPAWRNQKGVETNNRSCKHIKELLGEAYEAARLARGSSGSSSSGATSGAKPVSKATRPTSSRAAAAAAKVKPESKATIAKKPASKAAVTVKPESKAKPESKKPASKGKAAPAARAGTKRKKAESDIEEEDEAGEGDDGEGEAEVGGDEEEVEAEAEVKAEAKEEEVKEEVEDGMDVDDAGEGDELAVINGVRPNILLADEETREVGSKTSKSVYKVKRTLGHYYCTCPAWRNQKGVETSARSCKHIKELLGEKYEEARIARAQAGGAHAPVSKAGPESKVKPESKAKPESKVKPASKAKGKAKVEPVEEQDEDEAEAEGEDEDGEGEDDEGEEGEEEGAEPVDGDELAVINGVKPNFYMKDGDETTVKSLTSSSSYKVKRTWDHYYCACPAWRNQAGAPVNARSCKHLASLLGAEYETARLQWKNPGGPIPKAPGAKKGKAKGKDGDGEEGEGIPGLLLATKWDIEGGADPTGWWISEKLDGVRAYYDGKGGFWSRLGNPFAPPQWFTDALPKGVTLDGELFAGRGQFQDTVSIVKSANSPHWKNVSFQVFDVPSKGEAPFEERIEYLRELFEYDVEVTVEEEGEGEKEGGEKKKKSYKCEHVKVLEQVAAKSKEHVVEKLKEVEGLGGEGVMLRKPGSKYEGTRSSSLMKVKTFFDAEAIVTGYAAGKGKHAGSTGALQCKMASGKTFAVGSGLSDKQRKNPPKVGSIIVYRFQELTRDGVPRFPTFVGEAADKTEPKDAEVPAARRVGAGGDDA